MDSGEPQGPSTRTVTREGLYRRVWSSPATHVAAELGITSTALAKIARKLHVPVPPPGHWARKRAGQPLQVPTLPALQPGTPTRHAIVRRLATRVVEPTAKESNGAVSGATTVSGATAISAAPSAGAALALFETPKAEDSMAATAARSLAVLDRVASLRALVDRLATTIESLPEDSPKRRWLSDARAQLALADAEALAELGL